MPSNVKGRGKGRAKPKAKPKTNSKPKEQQITLLPDPAKDPVAIKLGTLTYPVKAVKGFTIASLKSRLKRHSVVVDRRQPNRQLSPNGLPAYLDLSNLCAVSPSSSSLFQPPLYLSLNHPDIDTALGEGPGGQVVTRTRSIHVLRVGKRLTSLYLTLPATIKANAAASSILTQAADLFKEEYRHAKQQQQQQQQQQQGTSTVAAADDDEDEDEDGWEPEFAESHLLSYKGGCLREGHCRVSTVEAHVQLNDAWFADHALLVLLLPQEEQQEAAAAAGPSRGGSKKRKSLDAELDQQQQQQQLGSEYMLVFASQLNESRSLLPWLLEMPQTEGSGSAQYKAVVKAYQKHLMQPHLLSNSARTSAIEGERASRLQKVEAAQAAYEEAHTMLVDAPGDEALKAARDAARERYTAARERAAASDRRLLAHLQKHIPTPSVDLLVDPEGLDHDAVERLLAYSNRFSTDRYNEASKKRRRTSYKTYVQAVAAVAAAEAAAAAAAEAEAAAAAAAAEAAAEAAEAAEAAAAEAGEEASKPDGENDAAEAEGQRQQQGDAGLTDATADSAPPAGAQEEEQQQPAAPAPPPPPPVPLQSVAYGRVAVLYASFSDCSMSSFNWSVRSVDIPDQDTARSVHQRQQADVSGALKVAYKAQRPFLDVVTELQALATSTRIPRSGNNAGLRLRPSIAVTLDLAQVSKGPKTAREGTLSITVYTWPSSSCPDRLHRSIDSPTLEAAHHRPWEVSELIARSQFSGQWVNTFTHVSEEDRDPWPEEGCPTRSNDDPSWLVPSSTRPVTRRLLLQQSTGLPLAATLHALLQQQEGQAGSSNGSSSGSTVFADWLDTASEWDRYVKREKEGGPLLLHLLKTGPQIAAPQPRGFARGLTLKPHQLEALNVMKGAEERPLGFNSVVWREVTLSGRSWWVSLLTGKISSSKPPKQATGGILAQDMGVGKTLCCLALILANKAPPSGPGGTAPGKALPSSECEGLGIQEEDEGAEEGAAADEDDVISEGDDAEGDGPAGDKDQSAQDNAEGADEEGDQAGDGQPAGGDRSRQGDALQQRDQQQDAAGSADAFAAAAAAPAAALAAATAAAAPGATAAAPAAAAAAAAAAGSSRGAALSAGTRLLYSRATLVVCAVSLVGQWADEATRRSDGNLRILQYHGSGRYRFTAQKLAKDYDIIVTTYNTLGTEWGGKRGRYSDTGSPLAHIKWWRVIFDEGHVLKSKTTIQSRAACSLVSDRRWVVTGTPLDSEIEELHGLLQALQVWPFTESRFAAQHIHQAFKGRSLRLSLCSPSRQMPLLSLLKSITIRHTKEVLQLPDKTVEDVPVYLNRAERRAYMTALLEAKRQWGTGMFSGNMRLQALALLQPMRRICSGGRLSERSLMVRDFAAQAAAQAAAAAGPAESVGSADCSGAECGLCLDSPEEPVAGPCGHVFCSLCIRDALSQERKCPTCSANLTISSLKPAQLQQRPAAAGSPAGGGGAAPQLVREPRGVEDDGPFVVCDSKLMKLKEELSAMRAIDSSAKALIFSSFQPTVDYLKQILPGWGYGFRFINGSMAMTNRTKAIEAFQQDPPTTVFILTLRSAACGINLTAASHIFMLEPCMNPAVEAQAIGRAWRMGQTRNVVVKRLYVKGSIEERTMQLAETAADRLQEKQGTHIGTLKGDGYTLWKDNMKQLLEDYDLPEHPPGTTAALVDGMVAGLRRQAHAAAAVVEEAAAALGGPEAAAVQVALHYQRLATDQMLLQHEISEDCDEAEEEEGEGEEEEEEEEEGGDEGTNVDATDDADMGDADAERDGGGAEEEDGEDWGEDGDVEEEGEEADNQQQDPAAAAAAAGEQGLSAHVLRVQVLQQQLREYHAKELAAKSSILRQFWRSMRAAAATALAELQSAQQEQDKLLEEERRRQAAAQRRQQQQAAAAAELARQQEEARHQAQQQRAAAAREAAAARRQLEQQQAAEAAERERERERERRLQRMAEAAERERERERRLQRMAEAVERQREQERQRQRLAEEAARRRREQERRQKKAAQKAQRRREREAAKRASELLAAERAKRAHEQQQQAAVEEARRQRELQQQQEREAREGREAQERERQCAAEAAAAEAAAEAASSEAAAEAAAAEAAAEAATVGAAAEAAAVGAAAEAAAAAAAREPLRSVGNTMWAEGNNQRSDSGKAATPAGAAEAVAGLKVPEGGASDPAFVDFVLEVMQLLEYSWEQCDAAEGKFMAMAEKAVNPAAAGAAVAATPALSTAGLGAAADVAAPGASQAAAQRWLHQFNAGLLRRHGRLAAAAAGRGGGGAEAAATGLKGWIEQHLLAEQH